MATKDFLTSTRRDVLKLGAAAVAFTALPAGFAKAASAGGTLKISVNVTPNLLNPMLHRLGSEYLMGKCSTQV